jgi:hypothetical protein
MMQGCVLVARRNLTTRQWQQHHAQLLDQKLQMQRHVLLALCDTAQVACYEPP